MKPKDLGSNPKGCKGTIFYTPCKISLIIIHLRHSRLFLFVSFLWINMNCTAEEVLTRLK